MTAGGTDADKQTRTQIRYGQAEWSDLSPDATGCGNSRGLSTVPLHLFNLLDGSRSLAGQWMVNIQSTAVNIRSIYSQYTVSLRSMYRQYAVNVQSICGQYAVSLRSMYSKYAVNVQSGPTIAD